MSKEEKHESDLTAKDKLEIEKQKLGSMNMKQKLEYLWTYYKMWLVVLILIIVCINIGVSIIQNLRTEELISIAVADTDYDTSDEAVKMESDLLEYLGTGGGYEKVTVDTSVMSGEDSSSVMKRTVVMGAGTVDLLICDESMYSSYEEQEAFRDWEDVLGDAYEQYAPYMEDGKIDLSKSEKWQEYGLTAYEPVYMAVLGNSEKEDMIRKVLQFYFVDG